MKPEVSVILPFYNAENTLERGIKSVLNQTFTDFELILVDNNSTDKSDCIAKNLSKKDCRIKLLKEKKQGVADAMNCGLRNANGQFIARMDSDDISHPERLEKQVQFLHENPKIDFIGSEVKYVAHINNTEGFRRFVDWSNSFHSEEAVKLQRFIEIPIINPTIMFRCKLFEKYGGCIDGDFPEDYEIQLRYLAAGVKMAKLNEPLLEWHDYSTRLTRTDERYSSEAFFRVKTKYFKYWSEKHNPFHPHIWVWGAGRKTRQRAKLLEKEGIQIQGYIDIVKSKTTKKKIIHFTEIPGPGKIFVVPMVGNYGARDQIKGYLKHANYMEGKDFILMG